MGKNRRTFFDRPKTQWAVVQMEEEEDEEESQQPQKRIFEVKCSFVAII